MVSNSITSFGEHLSSVLLTLFFRIVLGVFCRSAGGRLNLPRAFDFLHHLELLVSTARPIGRSIGMSCTYRLVVFRLLDAFPEKWLQKGRWYPSAMIMANGM